MEEDLSPFQVGLYEQGAKLGHQEWVQIEGVGHLMVLSMLQMRN